MQGAMDRLEGLTRRHRRPILALWLALLLAALPFAARQTDHLTSGGFEAPGSGSRAVDSRLGSFAGMQREPLAIVLAGKPGSDAGGVRAALARVERATREVPHIGLSRTAAAGAIRRAATNPIVIVPLQVSGDQDKTADAASTLRRKLHPANAASQGVQLHLVGQEALWAGMQDLSKRDLASGERVGFPVVLIILLAVFGSLAAAALPLSLGFASVALTGASIFFLSQATQMSVFVTNVASMIGIGVAVDYSLFVLARYREEVRAGADPDSARRTAMRTSGLAVAFSGATVMLSLAGLFLVNSTTIRSMATGAIIVVAVSILAAVTLLPALIGVLGHRAYARGRLAVVTGLVARNRWWSLRRRRGSTRPDVERVGFWQRWTDRVTRRPWLTAGLSAAALLALAWPALSLQFGEGALRQFPTGFETRVGTELAAKAQGPGAAGPLLVVARPANDAALARYSASLRRDTEVASISPPRHSRDGSAALIAVTPRHDPESSQALALVSRLRAHSPAGERIDVGGPAGQVKDFRDLVAGSMWKVLLFVMAFSYVVLLVLLRSAILPLKAVLMNLLSVAAAYGVLVVVFQWGWFDGLLGFHHLGYVHTLTPPFLLAIVFGLSMDYEVFLLTRIRERYDATGDNRRAVAQGLAGSARTISSAALIMVSVFAAFALTGVPSVKEIGVGLGAAIALDATLVRLVLVPATMELLGRWNWWLPRPLARVLPRASFEGASPEPARA